MSLDTFWSKWVERRICRCDKRDTCVIRRRIDGLHETRATLDPFQIGQRRNLVRGATKLFDANCLFGYSMANKTEDDNKNIR